MQKREKTMTVRRIIYWASISRIIIFCLQLFFNLIPDHQANAFRSNISEHGSGIFNFIVNNAFDGFHKWDAKYFVHIAKTGYVNERYFAFFPLYPCLMNATSTIFSTVLPLNKTSSILLAGSLVNFLCFIGAAVYLYKLSSLLYNEKLAWYACIIFSFNPSSIFFSAIYTEAFYCFTSFAGMYFVIKNQHFTASISFFLAAATRSNGIINLGYIFYYELLSFVHHAFHIKSKNSDKIFKLLKFSVTLLACAVIITMPFILFNLYGYSKFCTGTMDQKSWCNSTVPLMYSYVQSTIWNLGFMQYYQLRKIPNVLLASPCIVLTVIMTCNYVYKNDIKYLEMTRIKCTYCTQRNKQNKKYFTNCNILAFLCHHIFLVAFGMCFMHVEVITRMVMSSSPVLYWFMASTLLNDSQNITNNMNATDIWNMLSILSKMILCYCLCYTVIGTFMHTNFLPWT